MALARDQGADAQEARPIVLRAQGRRRRVRPGLDHPDVPWRHMVIGEQPGGEGAGDQDQPGLGQGAGLGLAQRLGQVGREPGLLGQGVVHQGHEPEPLTLRLRQLGECAEGKPVDDGEGGIRNGREDGFGLPQCSRGRHREAGVQSAMLHPPAQLGQTGHDAPVVAIAPGGRVEVPGDQEPQGPAL